MHLKIQRSLVLIFSLMVWIPGPAAEISGRIERVGDATHFEFEGRTNWVYQVRREADGRSISIDLPPIQEVVRKSLESWSDPLIKSIKVSTNGIDGSHVATIDTVSPKVAYFDYVTDQPSRLVIDLYEPEEKKTGQAEDNFQVFPESKANPTSNNGLVTKLPKKNRSTKRGHKVGRHDKKVRKPAGTDFIATAEKGEVASPPIAEQSDENLLKSLERGLFDGGDPEYRRFQVSDYEIDEKAIIAAKKNIYIRFPPLHDKSTGLEALFARPIEYVINPKKNDEENRMARLLLTLYKNDRPAIYMRTLKFFRSKYPESQYDQILNHLTADIHYKIWEKEKSTADFQQAISLYQTLVQQFPDSPLAERTQLLVGKAFLDRGDSLGTLKIFERFLRERPNSTYTDQVRLIIAGAYQQLNKYDLAVEKLNELEANAKQPIFSRKAAFLRGDVYFQKGDYETALKQYDQAISKYKDSVQDHPNTFYNRAESLFWLERYKESVNAFREFVIRFPSDSHNSYALTRIGELMEILGVDEKRYMGAFFEGHYRYRGTDGAHVAWLRLLRKRMVGMKESEVDAAVKQVVNVAKTSHLPFFEDFTTLMIADGYFNRKEYSKALSYLINFYQKNPTSTNLEVFEDRILRTIAESIRYQVTSGNFMEALRIYGRHSDTWLRKSGRIDVNYYLGRSFEIAGVYKEAAEIYFNTLNSLYSLTGTKAEKERTVFEVLPSTDKLNLRLCAVQVRLGQYNKAETYLKNIKDDSGFTEDEHLEKMQLSVAIAKANHNIKAAKAYLTQLSQVWKSQPRRLSRTLLELAKLELEENQLKPAESALNTILALQQDTKSVDTDVHSEALELKGRVMQKLGKLEDAVLYFEKALATYGDSEAYDPLRYETGKILFGLGRSKDAEQMWSKLAVREDSIWAKMAQANKREQDWNKDYNKYVNRIPAMAEKSGEGGK